MIVVSNTSPLCYLRLIEHHELLPTLFGEICVARAVLTELADSRAPEVVRSLASRPPAWLKLHDIFVPADPALARLHSGERETIALAHSLNAGLVLLDEKAGRAVASSRGLRIGGVLGVLEEAATRGLIDLPAAVERLRQTNFRASPTMLHALLVRCSKPSS